MNRRSPLPLLLGAVLAILGPLVLAGPAQAHDDKGVITVVQAAPAGLSVDYQVTVTYSGDGDPANGATVTTVAEAGGTTVGPVALTASGAPGTYVGTLDLPSPGDWAVRISSLSPAGVLERTEQVEATPGPTTAPAPVATTPPPATTVATTTSTTSTTADPHDNGVGGAGGEGTAVLVGVIVVVVVGGAFVVWTTRRRRSRR